MMIYCTFNFPTTNDSSFKAFQQNSLVQTYEALVPVLDDVDCSLYADFKLHFERCEMWCTNYQGDKYHDSNNLSGYLT